MKVWNWKDLVHCKILALQYTNFISAQGIWHFFFLWKYTWERFLQIWRLTIDKYEFSQPVCFKVKVRSNRHSKDQDITSPNCLPYITNNSDSEKLMLNRKHPLIWCFFFFISTFCLTKYLYWRLKGELTCDYRFLVEVKVLIKVRFWSITSNTKSNTQIKTP